MQTASVVTIYKNNFHEMPNPILSYDDTVIQWHNVTS